MEWVDDTIVSNVDPKQFGGLAGTSTTDALVEMTHKWYEATDTLNTYVRIVLLDFSKAFDLINHNILLEKLQAFGISAPILRWMAAFLLDRTQRVNIGNNYSHTGLRNGGVPKGTICGPSTGYVRRSENPCKKQCRINGQDPSGSRVTPRIFPEPLPFRHDYGCVGPRDKGSIPMVHVIC